MPHLNYTNKDGMTVLFFWISQNHDYRDIKCILEEFGEKIDLAKTVKGPLWTNENPEHIDIFEFADKQIRKGGAIIALKDYQARTGLKVDGKFYYPWVN